MKRLAIEAAAALALCLALCIGAQWTLSGILDDAHEMTTEIYTAMETGEQDRAREKLVALATLWDEKSSLMDLFCDHDDLHNVKERIIQARICIDYEDMEEFYSAVALIGEGIEHIRDQEGLNFSNFL